MMIRFNPHIPNPNVASWNPRTLYHYTNDMDNTRKRRAIRRIIRYLLRTHDIVILQETHLDEFEKYALVDKKSRQVFQQLQGH